MTYIRTLSYFEILLWISNLLAQVSVLFSIKRSGLVKLYPIFTLYVWFVALESLCLLYIAFKFPAQIFGWAYFPASFFECLLMLAVVAESFLMTYGPAKYLPAGTWSRVWNLLVACCGSWLMIGGLLRATNGGMAARVMATAERMMIGLVLASMVVILWCSQRIGISWRSHRAGIAFGFVLLLSGDVASAFVRGNAHSMSMKIAARELGLISSLAVLIYWTCCLWEKEKLPERRPEVIDRLRSQLNGMRANAGALGYKDER